MNTTITKNEAISDIRAVQRILVRGRRPRSKAIRIENAIELDKVVSCLTDDANYIDNGGAKISRANAATLLGECSHYAFVKDKQLCMRINELSLSVYNQVEML